MTVYTGGEVIAGRYRVDAFHGEGGMQEVYRATDLTFRRVVALKVPKNASAQKRFKDSAKLAAQVNHPNVAKTLDFFVDDDREHLAEEFIDGEDIGQALARYGIFDPFLAAHLFHHLAKGVAASHAAGVFHRDLKPSNILISREVWPRVAKVTDFGIAIMTADHIIEAIKFGISKSLSTSRTLVGAIPYMAPELIKTPKEAGLAADVWAIGAMLYEFLTGTKPFGEDLAAVAEILAGNLPAGPVSMGNQGQFGVAIDELWSIITACLNMNPKNRPKAKDVCDACGRLCYSAYHREEGIVVRYFIKNMAIGFISRAKGDDVFFHRDSFYGLMPKVNQNVVFSCFEGGGAPRAHPVVPMK